jgi:hypothetical protein
MKLKMLAFATAGTLALAVPHAVFAQSEYPLQSAEWVEISSIKIDDGHGLRYANHLATIWRNSQDYALSQGWISGYEVLMNSHPREGEPDVYLLTRFTQWADPAEEDRRDAAFRAHMQATSQQMEAASADRANYRHLAGQRLLRRMIWRD